MIEKLNSTIAATLYPSYDRILLDSTKNEFKNREISVAIYGPSAARAKKRQNIVKY